MDDDTYSGLSSTHLIGSVPAVVDKEIRRNEYVAPEPNSQSFPPKVVVIQGGGYQRLGGPSGGGPIGGSPNDGSSQPSTNSNWQGFFSISSYMQYFNVDTDVVVNRIISSLDPLSGDFFSKIDANPDLYGLIWISTSLIFVIASLGNLATYTIEKTSDSTTSWSFDVGYVNIAVCVIYGYAIVVPLAFHFLLQYLGSNTNLVRFWCMWGYSLSTLVLSTVLLVIPVEFLRWLVVLAAGGASACFVASNLKSYVVGNDLTIVLVAAFLMQFALALFIKIEFFP